MAARLPTQVPLPEVARHTEDIVIGGLDLPVGFDQDRLLINLRAMNTVRQAAVLGRTSIVAQTGEEVYEANIESVDSQGTATIGFAAKRTKQPLSSTTVKYETNGDMLMDSPTTVIKVDNTEIESRIDEANYEDGAFDVKGRAKFLNKAIKQGLAEADFDANLSILKFASTTVNVAMFEAMGQAEIIPLGKYAPLIGGVATRMVGATVASTIGLLLDGPQAARHALKNYRYSLTYGIAPDRYLAARGLLLPRRLIKARP